HTHAIALIEGLQAALDAKSPTSHTHAIALIQGLQAALDAKSPTSHTHAISEISGLQAALDNKTSASPGAWQELPLASGWSLYATGFASPQCRKLVGDLIEIKGVIKKSTALVTNEIIATLPIGYRPLEIMLVTTFASGGTSRLQIEPNGAIKLLSGNSGGVGLGFIFGLN
ncbi:phage tail repeat domain-containing protein, partial [Plectonema radiosum NIES-515]|nr:phage tail repeat domain-containing protein [Plectonema radiosum NIES-515]